MLALLLTALSFFTHPLVPEVKTLQAVADADFRKLPVIDPEGDSSVEISFDYLAVEEPTLWYRLVHCDQDWRPSGLSELEYLEGFLPVRVDEVAPSFNTFTSYYHYSVTFPNPDVRLLVSGNYAVVFSTDGLAGAEVLTEAPSEKRSETSSEARSGAVAVATFSVSEQMAFVRGEISGNTDIDYRRSHQMLSLGLSWSNRQLPHLNPADEVTLVVTQNRRRDTRHTLRRPTRIEAQAAIYEHQPGLIWEAGNEWRRFEFTDERHTSLGVDRVRYHAPDYYAHLWLDKPRRQYLFDADQEGRYLIHAVRVEDAATEADYFRAVFTLEPTVLPAAGQGIYLVGDLTYGLFDESTRMHFDAESGLYTQTLLLKMGHYNYMYALCDDAPHRPASGSILAPAGTPLSGSTLPPRSALLGRTEGNFYETRNEYEVYVYYRPFGSRYDRLLGVAVIAQP